MTTRQLAEIAELCAARGVKRSTLIRDLVRHAYIVEFSPEDF
jgi:hypothetical protein